MGGTTVLNGLMYCRGDSSDYDEYEKLGATGWGYKNVLPYFLKSEHNLQYNVSRYTKNSFSSLTSTFYYYFFLLYLMWQCSPKGALPPNHMSVSHYLTTGLLAMSVQVSM